MRTSWKREPLLFYVPNGTREYASPTYSYVVNAPWAYAVFNDNRLLLVLEKRLGSNEDDARYP